MYFLLIPRVYTMAGEQKFLKTENKIGEIINLIIHFHDIYQVRDK